MASRKDANPSTEGLPFGAMERTPTPSGAAVDADAKTPKPRAPRRKASKKDEAASDEPQAPARSSEAGERTSAPADDPQRDPVRDEARDRERDRQRDAERDRRRDAERDRERDRDRDRNRGESGERSEPSGNGSKDSSSGGAPRTHDGDEKTDGPDGERRWQKRRRGRRGRRGGRGRDGGRDPATAAQGDGTRTRTQHPHSNGQAREQRPPRGDGGPDRNADRPDRPDHHGDRDGDRQTESREVEGMFVLEKANHGHLRRLDRGLMPHKTDVHVSPRMVQTFQLRDGAIVKGVFGRGQGKSKYDLREIETIDGRDPRECKNLPVFKNLTSIDPDFHYAVGDGSGETSLKIVDLICPIGRGQRGLIVAPPRSGKTILLQQFAKAVEEIYPDVHLIVLLVDERPEEATEWKRTVKNGHVFVSTNDEMHKTHVELCESVWRLVRRKIELGEDVILLMDSITRIGRAYNNVHGNSGKTMSGGLDTRALERPKQLFGSARNTETAGSLTILATALIETGSMMDKVIFEEFKGTGNMELVLSRKLADRRIFPAIDIEKSGTRKEEKLLSSLRHKRITTLRRVLHRMHWAEAMELLITKLDDVEKIDDFLKRFDIDPEA
jgi:transcription termination factor Rho